MNKSNNIDKSQNKAGGEGGGMGGSGWGTHVNPWLFHFNV